MNSERIGQFEAYYSNQLSQSDRIIFEKELKEDKTVSDDYRRFLQISDSLTHANSERLKTKISAIQNSSNDKTVVHRINYTRLLAAASILALICLSLYFYVSSPPSNEQLFSDFYTPYSERVSVLSDQTLSMSTCLEFYNRSNYQEAQTCLTRLPQSAEKDFFSAMCFIQLEAYEKAIIELEKVEKSATAYQEESNWYLALLYLRENNIQEVRDRLQLILDNSKSNYKKQSAQKLLSKL